jgi:hypothetical protein
MGVQFSFGFPGVESHEGYGARRLPSGKLTSSWTHETREFTAYVAACDCGWSGGDYPPTDDGEEAAVEEWRRTHMAPLFPKLARGAARREAPGRLERYVEEAVDGLPTSTAYRAIRSLVATASLAALATEAERRLHAHVAKAREANASWSEIGDALGISKQAAHERFGR